MKIKVRGIYSTALTKLLMENGFNIVGSSDCINKRLNIDPNNGSADILVYDKEDINGVTVNGNGAEKVVEMLQKHFFDTSIKKVETGDIYCGKIKRIETKMKNIFVDLGNEEEGILNLQNYWGFLREGEKVLVQVKGVIRGVKLLSTQLRLFGNNLILIKDGFTKVSKHIFSQNELNRLIGLSKNVKIKGWGILWKAQAEGKLDSELIAEINELIKEEKELKERFNETNESQVLKRGSCTYFVDFGSISKSSLDKIRRDITNTIMGHHFLKAGGYMILTEFAESLDNLSEEVIKSKVNYVLRSDGPKTGMFYEIIHKKPGGRDVIFKGTVEKADEDEIIIKRDLRGGGRLNGIGGTTEEGDFAITKLKPNNWFITHEYFDKSGAPKGVYTSVNTPIEVYPKFARYIDLEVDVIEKDGNVELVDLEKLQKVVESRIIKKELGDKALEIANQLLRGNKE